LAKNPKEGVAVQPFSSPHLARKEKNVHNYSIIAFQFPGQEIWWKEK